MTDKEGFSFEEEEKSPSGAGSGLSWMEQEENSKSSDPSDNGRKGSRTRILLLLLLLIVAGAAGFHFLLGPSGIPEPPAPSAPAAVKKQPIAVPPRPVEEASPIGKESVAAAEGTASQSPAPETPKPVEEVILPQKSTEVVQAVADEKIGLASSSDASGQLAGEGGDYIVAAGAFLLRSNLAEAERKVHASGFVPHVVQKKKKMDMTRLRVGTFSTQEGKKKIEELVELAPDAFYLPVEGGMAVYAASFLNLDKARNFADRLYQKGLRVEEESARVEISLYFLSFGGFADLESARKAAGQARAAGLDTMVVKNL